MTKEDKTQFINHLSEKLLKSQATFLIDFKGMSVEEVTHLRKKLHPDSEMKVVKNTLALRALSEHKEVKEVMEPRIEGSNAFIFSYGEPNETAKKLVDFSKTVDAFDIKGGYFDGKDLDTDKIKYLAKIPSKDELRATLLGVFQAPMAKFVRTLNEVPSSFVRVLEQYKNKEKK